MLSTRFKGGLSLVAGTLIMLIIGSLYTFGTFTVYISSYLNYHHEPGIATVTISTIFPFLIIFMNVGVILGPQLGKILNIRIVVLLSITLYSSTIFGLSYLESLIGYMILYGGCNGLFIGLPYILPIGNAYKYFPNHKGLCSGICIMGLGFGSLIFNQIIIHFMNPDNIKKDPSGYFPIEVANNLPKTFKILSLVYFGMGVFACSILFPWKKELDTQVQSNQKRQSVITQTNQTELLIIKKYKECQSLKDALSVPIYYSTILLIAFTTSFGMFIAFNYKEYGLTGINDDKFLTLVGSLGGITNGSSRFIWGYLLDKFSFKSLMLLVNISLLILSLTINLIVTIKPLFAIYIILVYFFYGGLFAIFPAKTYQLFGSTHGSRIYGYVFIGFSLSSTIQFLLHYFMVSTFGKQGFLYSFYILAGLQVTALFMTIFIKYEINWQSYYQKQDLRALINKTQPSLSEHKRLNLEDKNTNE